jgi:predicted DNA-binding transcriptional regulator AlpA
MEMTHLRWLTAKDVGHFLSISPDVVRKRIALTAGFPKPLRLNGTGHPRWREDEIVRWANAHRDDTGGRPRKE